MGSAAANSMHCDCVSPSRMWKLKDGQHTQPDLHIHLVVSFTCTALVFQMLFFFFFSYFFTCPSVIAEGWRHISNKKILLVSLSRLILTV